MNKLNTMMILLLIIISTTAINFDNNKHSAIEETDINLDQTANVDTLSPISLLDKNDTIDQSINLQVSQPITWSYSIDDNIDRNNDGTKDSFSLKVNYKWNLSSDWGIIIDFKVEHLLGFGNVYNTTYNKTMNIGLLIDLDGATGEDFEWFNYTAPEDGEYKISISGYDNNKNSTDFKLNFYQEIQWTDVLKFYRGWIKTSSQSIDTNGDNEIDRKIFDVTTYYTFKEQKKVQLRILMYDDAGNLVNSSIDRFTAESTSNGYKSYTVTHGFNATLEANYTFYFYFEIEYGGLIFAQDFQYWNFAVPAYKFYTLYDYKSYTTDMNINNKFDTFGYELNWVSTVKLSGINLIKMRVLFLENSNWVNIANIQQSVMFGLDNAYQTATYNIRYQADRVGVFKFNLLVDEYNSSSPLFLNETSSNISLDTFNATVDDFLAISTTEITNQIDRDGDGNYDQAELVFSFVGRLNKTINLVIVIGEYRSTTIGDTFILQRTHTIDVNVNGSNFVDNVLQASKIINFDKSGFRKFNFFIFINFNDYLYTHLDHKFSNVIDDGQNYLKPSTISLNATSELIDYDNNNEPDTVIMKLKIDYYISGPIDIRFHLAVLVFNWDTISWDVEKNYTMSEYIDAINETGVKYYQFPFRAPENGLYKFTSKGYSYNTLRWSDDNLATYTLTGIPYLDVNVTMDIENRDNRRCSDYVKFKFILDYFQIPDLYTFPLIIEYNNPNDNSKNWIKTIEFIDAPIEDTGIEVFEYEIFIEEDGEYTFNYNLFLFNPTEPMRRNVSLDLCAYEWVEVKQIIVDSKNTNNDECSDYVSFDTVFDHYFYIATKLEFELIVMIHNETDWVQIDKQIYDFETGPPIKPFKTSNFLVSYTASGSGEFKFQLDIKLDNQIIKSKEITSRKLCSATEVTAHTLSKPIIQALPNPSNGIVTINWTRSVDSYAHALTYRLGYSLDNDTWTTIGTTSSNSINWDLDNISNGNYNLQLLVFDTEGKTSVSYGTIVVNNEVSVTVTTTRKITETSKESVSTESSSETSTKEKSVLKIPLIFLSLIMIITRRRKYQKQRTN